MTYSKWIVLGYIIFFELFFFRKNRKTKQETGLPINGTSWNVKIAMMLGGLIFMVVLTALFVPAIYRVYIPISFLPSHLLTILGDLLLFVSILMALISARELGTSWRVGILENQKPELVTTGIYQFCRNPYFFSYFIMFFAFFLIIPSMVLAILFIITLFWFHQLIKDEEKYLEKVYGSEYIDYCQKVGRYFLKLKSLEKLRQNR